MPKRWLAARKRPWPRWATPDRFSPGAQETPNRKGAPRRCLRIFTLLVAVFDVSVRETQPRAPPVRHPTTAAGTAETAKSAAATRERDRNRDDLRQCSQRPGRWHTSPTAWDWPTNDTTVARTDESAHSGWPSLRSASTPSRRPRREPPSRSARLANHGLSANARAPTAPRPSGIALAGRHRAEPLRWSACSRRRRSHVIIGIARADMTNQAAPKNSTASRPSSSVRPSSNSRRADSRSLASQAPGGDRSRQRHGEQRWMAADEACALASTA